jgi:hypothetical protein
VSTPCTLPVGQSTIRLAALKKGYPRMMSSLPMSATRNRWAWQWLSWATCSHTSLVTSPSWLSVPSILQTFLGRSKSWVKSFSSSTICRCRNNSVAPLSRRALLVALSLDVYIVTGVFIAQFHAIYTDVSLQAQVRATALKPQQNPAPCH